MAEEIDYRERHISAGIAAASLIATPATWINRRVETIHLLSHEETRRQVSIDFTLSIAQRESLTIEDGVAVPISVMTKEPRRNFDLRDESGSALPVLGKRSNSELAHAAVMGRAFDAVAGIVDQDEFNLVWTELREVVVSEPAVAVEALGNFVAQAETGDSLRSAIWADLACRGMLKALQNYYVLFAVIDGDCANRRILKYSFGEDFRPDERLTASFAERLSPGALIERIWRPGRRTFELLCTGAWRAESFHLEIVIPEDLRIDLAFLYDYGREAVLSTSDQNRNRASLYAQNPVSSDFEVFGHVVVAPERRGRTTQAAVTGCVVTGLLWFGVTSGLSFSNPDAPGASASIVLAGAALYSGITAGRGEPSLVSRVFLVSRLVLGCISLCALVASASLAMEVPSASPRGIWWVVAIVATFASFWLVWLRIRSPVT